MNEVMPKVANHPPQDQIYEFSKEERTQIISIDKLKRSIRRESGLATGLRDIPTQFWTLYAMICQLIDQNNLNYTEEPIYIQHNSSKAYLTDYDKSLGYDSKRAPVEKWRHDKIITSIQLPAIVAGEASADVRNAAIGLTVNKEGLVVAFGMNVHVCSNFNVLGGTLLRSYTYGGNEGMTWDLMKHKMQSWISNLNQLWTVQNELMNDMKSIAIPQGENMVEEIIGDLYIRAIKQAYFKGGLTPFDTHELSNFTKEMIQARKTEDRLANVWDLYNWGTSIMKPGTVDIGEIANNSNLWSDYLLDRFEISVPDAILVD